MAGFHRILGRSSQDPGNGFWPPQFRGVQMAMCKFPLWCTKQFSTNLTRMPSIHTVFGRKPSGAVFTRTSPPNLSTPPLHTPPLHATLREGGTSRPLNPLLGPHQNTPFHFHPARLYSPHHSPLHRTRGNSESDDIRVRPLFTIGTKGPWR